MPMDTSSFKAAIEALPNGQELYGYHVQSVEAEKQRGIEESRKANNEAQNLRRFKIALEKIGYQKDTDVDAFVDTLKVATTKAGEADQAKMSLEQVVKELNTLKNDYTKTSTELAAEKQRADELKLNATKKTLKSKLADVLRDRVYGHDFVIDSLITNGEVSLADDESVVFKSGDKTIDLNAGVAKLLETRTDIVRNGQKPGASTPPPQGRSGQKYTQEQINSMSREDIKANLADVKASLGITT